jgi:hypothetical protein
MGIWNGQHGFSGVEQQQMMQEARCLGLNDTGAGTPADDKTGQLAIAKGPRARPRKTTSTRSRQQLRNQGGPKFGPAAAAQHLRRAPCFLSLITEQACQQVGGQHPCRRVLPGRSKPCLQVYDVSSPHLTCGSRKAGDGGGGGGGAKLSRSR